MSTIVKKRIRLKIKIKWKNFIIFLIILFLIIFGIIKLITGIVRIINPPKTIKEKPVTAKKINTNKEIKLAKLDNIDKEINYFNMDYLDRYVLYKEDNPEMPTKQVIKNVNMNLDQEFYKDSKEARNQNTEKILVNKYYYLGKDYVPNNLENISTRYALSNMKMVKEAKNAFEELASTAKEEKLNIIAMSTYRSYEYQVNLYNRYVRSDGKEKADTYSGRPGHSEHQTGLAVDVYNGKENYTNFEKTKEFEWMKKHAHEFGFILRFPKNKESETGYIYEAWHYRYVGKEVAAYIKEHDISFEEYYATIIKDW
ncbi:MAG: M15 family metallopeptidase [Bacilli bacterium]|nr:M15 family metallopeptidase [Bacilli bacterium]